jgi:hypothetical protein
VTVSGISGEEQQPLASRDDEGGVPGATDPADHADPYAKALPDGITSRLVREYLVGPYRYTDLAQAIAERDRQRAG